MSPKKLSSDRQAQARGYMQRRARVLEWLLYRYHFDGLDAATVARELADYQNADGGFAYGLESDLRTPHSSAIATAHALQIFRELSGCSREPARGGNDRGDRSRVQASDYGETIQRAMSYLRETLDRGNLVWPIIPPTANQAPHAPWWTTKDLAKSWNGFRGNPTAELVGYFFVFGTADDEPLRQEILQRVIDYLDARAPDMHELLCYVRLAEMVDLPLSAQQKIKQSFLEMVEPDPLQWAQYRLQPLTVVKSPSSPYYDALREAVDANLDYLIATQQDDGSWQPTWSWAASFPGAWPLAQREWSGVLTLDALKVLRAFGRM